MSAEQKAITVNGQRLSYLEDGTGPTVVFLHGMGGAPPTGANFVASLAKERRVLLPSLPGWDDSELGGCATHDDLAEVIAAFIQQSAQGAVDLIGESAGSPVALRLTINHPALVDKLVLVAPPVLGPLH